ncbi:MAG: hypothetical protein LC777_02895 [Actinobacteria bacterium]|nr:hypothetical protein [Actinomycetota bacterium]
MSEDTVVREVLADMTTLDGERLAEPAPSTPVQANGGVVAALLAAGAACALLGALTVGASASEAIDKLLTFSDAVGPLSGKTVVPTLAWLVIWPVLHLCLRARELNLQRGCTVALALVALGLLGTFPPFYQLFAAGG